MTRPMIVPAPTPAGSGLFLIRAILCAGLALGCVFPLPIAHAQTLNVSKSLPTRSDLERAGLERHWSVFIPISPGNDHVLNISRVDKFLLAQTTSGYLFAYDAETGKKLWENRLAEITTNSLDAGINSSSVFVSSLQKVLKLDRKFGTIEYAKVLPSLPSSAPVADENSVVIGLRNGVVSSYDLKKGYVNWNYHAGLPITSRPILTKRVVAFGGTDGRLFVIANEKRKPSPLFRFRTGGPILANLSQLGYRTILVGSTDGLIYAVDLYNGEVAWSYSTTAPIRQAPLVSDDLIYVNNERGELTSLNLKQFWVIEESSGDAVSVFPSDQHDKAVTEAQKLDDQNFRNLAVKIRPQWIQKESDGQLLALSPKRVYLRDDAGELFIINRADGRLVTSALQMVRSGLDTRKFSLAITNDVNDRLYFATKDGLLVCLHEIGQDQPFLLRAALPKPFGYVPELDDPKPEDAAAPKSDADKDAAATPPEPDKQP